MGQQVLPNGSGADIGMVGPVGHLVGAATLDVLETDHDLLLPADQPHRRHYFPSTLRIVRVARPSGLPSLVTTTRTR